MMNAANEVHENDMMYNRNAQLSEAGRVKTQQEEIQAGRACSFF